MADLSIPSQDDGDGFSHVGVYIVAQTDIDSTGTPECDINSTGTPECDIDSTGTLEWYVRIF